MFPPLGPGLPTLLRRSNLGLLARGGLGGRGSVACDNLSAVFSDTFFLWTASAVGCVGVHAVVCAGHLALTSLSIHMAYA